MYVAGFQWQVPQPKGDGARSDTAHGREVLSESLLRLSLSFSRYLDGKGRSLAGLAALLGQFSNSGAEALNTSIICAAPFWAVAKQT